MSVWECVLGAVVTLRRVLRGDGTVLLRGLGLWTSVGGLGRCDCWGSGGVRYRCLGFRV